ncbi:hypothetical protein H4S07_004746, partial [Coemansia furcata]
RLLALSETQGSQHQGLLRSDAGTPPLSPTGIRTAAATTTTTTHGLTAAVSAAAAGMLSSPLDSIAESPITPADSVRSGQGVYMPMDKQQLLGNSMITPLTSQSKRLIAGTTGSLPNSYRTFVATATTGEKPSAAAHQEQSATAAPGAKPKSDVTMCGRRMFVAALMCASKFMYDRSYANKAWNKFTKLPLEQLGDMERGFLNMIDYRLYVEKNTYDKFHRLLARSCMRNGRLMVCDPASRSVSNNSVSCDKAKASAVNSALPMTPLTPPLTSSFSSSASSAATEQYGARRAATAAVAVLAQRLDGLSSTGSTAVSTPMVSSGYGGGVDVPAMQIREQALLGLKFPTQQQQRNIATTTTTTLVE